MDKIPYVSEHYFWTRITGIENYPCAPTHSLPAKCSENLKDITQKRNLHLKMRWSWLIWAGFLLKLYTFSNFEAPFESCALTFQQRRSRCQLRFTICYKFQELEQVESSSLLCCDDQHTLPFLTGGIRKVHLSWLIRNIQESRIFGHVKRWWRTTLIISPTAVDLKDFSLLPQKAEIFLSLSLPEEFWVWFFSFHSRYCFLREGCKRNVIFYLRPPLREWVYTGERTNCERKDLFFTWKTFGNFSWIRIGNKSIDRP